MEMDLNNGFCEMSQGDMCFVEGGGWSEAGAGLASVGTDLLDWACR